MKKIVIILIAMLLLFTGCSAGKDNDSPSETGNPTSQTETPVVCHEETEKYYDYYMRHSYIVGDESGEFTDRAMGMYVYEEFPVQHGRNPTRAELDAATKKYFGKTIQDYDSIPEAWSPTPHVFILKELEARPDGVYTGVFYVIGLEALAVEADGTWDVPQTAKDAILKASSNPRIKPFLLTTVFEEKTDENGEMYLRYYNAKWGGEAEPPYVPY